VRAVSAACACWPAILHGTLTDSSVTSTGYEPQACFSKHGDGRVPRTAGHERDERAWRDSACAGSGRQSRPRRTARTLRRGSVRRCESRPLPQRAGAQVLSVSTRPNRWAERMVPAINGPAGLCCRPRLPTGARHPDARRMPQSEFPTAGRGTDASCSERAVRGQGWMSERRACAAWRGAGTRDPGSGPSQQGRGGRLLVPQVLARRWARRPQSPAHYRPRLKRSPAPPSARLSCKRAPAPASSGSPSSTAATSTDICAVSA
jgi:hypothetical protein